MILGLPEEELFAQGHRACAGCGSALAMRYALKAAGKNTIVVQATGCMEVVSTPYPETAWRVPYIHVAFENAAAVASGIYRALKKLGKDKTTKVLAIGGDGGTFDIGLQALSGSAERRERICYLCYDNGAYMNCLSTDSLIMTANGLKRITEIKVGEKVYAFDQKTYQPVLKRCIGVFDNGVKEVYELSTLHHTIKATSNHPFLVLKRAGKGKISNFVWKVLGELKVGEEVVILKKLKDTRRSFEFKPIKISKKGDYKVNKICSVDIPKHSSKELMEFLGVYTGDGWVRMSRCELGFALPKNTIERKRLVWLHKKLFKKEMAERDKNYIYSYSVNQAKFIESLGFGKGAKNKIIPPWVFTLPLPEKEAFVKGLMMSDGYCTRDSNRYVSASYDLLRTLRLLLQTMDYRVGKIHQQTKKKGVFCVYRQLLEDSTYGYICFSKKRKANISEYLSQTKQRDFLTNNGYFSTEKITSIKFVKKEPTLDLRVEGEHNFVADGIVVHNTGVQRSGATPKYAATTTSPAGKVIHGKAEQRKNMPFIMAAHGCYVATANIAYPQDFVAKMKKALNQEGTSYVQVFTPCPPGWRHEPVSTIAVARLAFETKAYPLFEIENGLVKLRKVDSPKPISSYLKMQGRFKHLSEKETAEIQRWADEEYEKLRKLEECGVRIN